MSGQAPLTEKFEAPTPDPANSGDAGVTVCEAPYDGVVTGVSYIASDAITGVDTNTRRVSLVNKGQDGTGTTEVAALQFDDGVDAVAFDDTPLTLSATPEDRDVVAGDVLAFVSTHVGTGLGDPGGTVVVEISRS